MAKGYWIVRVDISDPVAYQDYVKANADPMAAGGGRFVVRGGRSEAPEGVWRARCVVVEFPTYQAALDCYKGDAYQTALKLRTKASEADFLIIEGYDGPQPGA